MTSPSAPRPTINALFKTSVLEWRAKYLAEKAAAGTAPATPKKPSPAAARR
jgi:hypothetical protein